MRGMSILDDTSTSTTATIDTRLTELRDWVRTQPLGLVHARLNGPASEFTSDELDQVSDAVALGGIDSIATWSGETAALHDFYRRHHEDVAALREMVDGGFNTRSELSRLWAARTGIDAFPVRTLLSLTQAASIGEWWTDLARTSIAARDRESALGEINNAAEAVMDIAGQLEDAPHLTIARLAARLEKIGEDEWTKLRRILPDVTDALHQARLQLERETIFATSTYRKAQAAAA
jgi:hypothetical protein